ncbi:MAG: TolC family protein [Rikenellaceae bacterium]
MKKIIITFALLFGTLAIKAQETLTLSDAIQRGVNQSFGISIAKSNTQISTEQNTWGAAGAYPTLSFLANGSISTAFDETIVSGYAKLSSSWTVFNGFYIRRTKSILANTQELTEGLEMLEIENTIKGIIGSYYYVLMAQRSIEIAEEMYKLSYDLYNQKRDAIEWGGAGSYDLIQVEAAYLEDKKSLVQTKLAFENALIELNNLMSEPEPSKLWVLSDDLNVPTNSYELATMQDKMLSSNTTLKNQYINQKARELEITQARSGYAPTISLTAAIGETASGTYSNKDGYNSTSTSVFGIEAGLTLSYAIFNNGVVRRNVSIANINKNITDTETDEMKNVLVNSLYMYYNQLNQYNNILSLSDQHVSVLETNLNMSVDRYKLGTISSFNFRDVQLSYMSASLSRLQTIYDLMMIDLELLQLTGGILSE